MGGKGLGLVQKFPLLSGFCKMKNLSVIKPFKEIFKKFHFEIIIDS